MKEISKKMEDYFDRLWPICRSLAGPGIIESYEILSEVIPLNFIHFPSGTTVYDWEVPKEWHPKDGYFIDPQGKKHADFKENNLHLLSYSTSFKGKISLSELKENLYSIPENPEAIPYRTSYYKPRWGFCMKHSELESLPEGEYDVFIDAEHVSGNLTLAENVIPGRSHKEIVVSSYLCHPSLANNELSGPLVLAFLYHAVKDLTFNNTIRFILGPETIGSLCYLSKHGERFKRTLKGAFIINTVGSPGELVYKQSKRGDTEIDRISERAIKDRGSAQIIPFAPIGSDERQYCSPGFNLPCGCFQCSPGWNSPEYHTSLDDKSNISFDHMAGLVKFFKELLLDLDRNSTPMSKFPFGEPQFGKRGLYRTIGTTYYNEELEQALFWIMAYADGDHDMVKISEMSGLSMKILSEAEKQLLASELLKQDEEDS